MKEDNVDVTHYEAVLTEWKKKFTKVSTLFSRRALLYIILFRDLILSSIISLLCSLSMSSKVNKEMIFMVGAPIVPLL